MLTRAHDSEFAPRTDSPPHVSQALNGLHRGPLINRLGVGQWFHYEAYHDLERAVSLLRSLGVKHLRTGISWADFHRSGGRAWYDYQMAALSEFEVLLSVWHTPPSISEGSHPASPPRDLRDYAAFIGQVIELYGDSFAEIELWNEPNNRYKWDFPKYDPEWRKFAHMVKLAGSVCHSYGKRTVLGGMIPVDPSWLCLIKNQGALEHVDVVGIHGFPGMWWPNQPNWEWYSHWHGWDQKVAKIEAEAEGRPVWITEAGFATWDTERACRGREEQQVTRLLEAVEARSPRVYWYSLIDLDPAREAIEGYHVDENEYHLGLVRYSGVRKPAYKVFHRLTKGEESLAAIT